MLCLMRSLRVRLARLREGGLVLMVWPSPLVLIAAASMAAVAAVATTLGDGSRGG